MTDEELVQAIENVVGSAIKASEERMMGRIAESEERMTERMTSRILEFEERMTERISAVDKKTEIISQDISNINMVLKNDIAPSLRKLADDYAVFAKKDGQLDKIAEDVKEMKTSLTTCVAAVTQVNQASDGN